MILKEAANQHGLGIVDGVVGGRKTLLSKLRSLFPGAITEDGLVDVTSLRKAVGNEYTMDSNQVYELRFVGKGVANYLAGLSVDMELKVECVHSRDFDVTSNLVIKGDNLSALKILSENYYSSIKMIYIDPPYNTGNDDFVYNDHFKKSEAELIEELGLDQETVDRFQNLYGTKTHSGWLAFMYPRLKIARDLLTDDGVMFISIDDHELANLKLVCDEIFGEESFVANIVVNVNRNGRRYKEVAINQEYILCYGKSNKVSLNELPKDPNFLNLEDDLGRYLRRELRNRNPKFTRRNRPNLYYPVYIDPTSANSRGECSVSLTRNAMHHVETFPKNSRQEDDCWRWGKNKIAKHITSDPTSSDVVAKKRRDGGWNIYEKYRKNTSKVKSIWDETEMRTELGTIQLRRLFGKDVFTYPKSVELILKCVRLASDQESTILDFFAGSGTTGEAVMRLNAEDGGSRRFILVQIDEEIKKTKKEAIEFCKVNRLRPIISSIMLERLKRAGNMIKKQHPDTDVGYKVFSLRPKPTITVNESQTKIFRPHTERTVHDILFNMLCATGKPLEVPIRMVVEGRLYEADGEMYVLGDVDLSGYRDRKIYVDGWGEDNTLEHYLNLPPSNVEVVYV